MEEKPPHCQDHADKAKLVNVQHLEAERSTSQQGRGLHMASRETFPLFPSDTTPPRSGCANKRSFRPRLIPSKGEREAGANTYMHVEKLLLKRETTRLREHGKKEREREGATCDFIKPETNLCKYKPSYPLPVEDT
ncbi:hypothetical protein JZ751_009303 [Albula glossodonta]|uniref:Uncharacterized protein n=1 Tax=Albula glossodonta TaxID=121402 RepID=A0A8T2NBX6_9TELE|nr:hypothetical protein JZ751_009303 [Albula glossodonta]